jgi:hypothetical protein
MSTWHQDQAMRRQPISLWDEELWTVIENPSNGHLCLSRFEDQDTAQVYLKNITGNKPKTGYYILPPMQKYMRRK